MTREIHVFSVFLGLIIFAAAPAHAGTIATFQFNNSLTADQGGVAALQQVDPDNQAGYLTETVFGQTRTVYSFGGTIDPTLQGGLSLDTTGLIASDTYSVEMVFKFTANDNAFRRILDVENRQSDNGFYVNGNNGLAAFPAAFGPSSAFALNTFYDVLLTVAPDNTVDAYLNGSLQFSTTTALMNVNNVGKLMNFYLDNSAGFNQDYSPGHVALIRLSNTVLSADDAATLARNPFAGLQQGNPVPEPSAVAVFALLAGLVGLSRRKLRARPKILLHATLLERS